MQVTPPADWLLPAIGFTVLSVVPLALMVWWRGPRVLLNLVLFVGVVGGGILLLIEFMSAAWHDFRQWYLPRLLGGIAAIAVGIAAGWASAPDDDPNPYVMGLSLAAGVWFGFWFGFVAFDMWRYALR
jgi:hypothetical protein